MFKSLEPYTELEPKIIDDRIQLKLFKSLDEKISYLQPIKIKYENLNVNCEQSSTMIKKLPNEVDERLVQECVKIIPKNSKLKDCKTEDEYSPFYHKYKPDCEINEGQRRIYDGILKDKNKIIAINAYAGVGKTFLAKYIQKQHPKQVLYLGKTNGVVEQADWPRCTIDRLFINLYGIQNCELHKKWFPFTSELNMNMNLLSIPEMREQEFFHGINENEREMLESYKFVIIDECFLVGYSFLALLFKTLLEFCRKDAKIIMLGDMYQNNAINSVQNLKTLMLADSIYVLQNNMRADDNELKTLLNYMEKDDYLNTMEILKKRSVDYLDMEDVCDRKTKKNKKFFYIAMSNENINATMTCVASDMEDNGFCVNWNRVKENLYIPLILGWKYRVFTIPKFTGTLIEINNDVLIYHSCGSNLPVKRVNYIASPRFQDDYWTNCFPVVPDHFMTSYSCQGKTLSNGPIYINAAKMKYDNLYVAVSRATRLNQIKILNFESVENLLNQKHGYQNGLDFKFVDVKMNRKRKIDWSSSSSSSSSTISSISSDSNTDTEEEKDSKRLRKNVYNIETRSSKRKEETNNKPSKATKPSKSKQSKSTRQKPSKPTKLAKSTKPTKPDKQVKQQTIKQKTSKPSKATKTTKPNKPVKPDKPTKPNKPTKTAKQTKLDEKKDDKRKRAGKKNMINYKNASVIVYK